MTESTWPAPPSYFLSGGPWTPPRIPAEGQRKRSAFNLLLVPDAAVPTSSSDSSSSSSSSSAAGAGLGLPPASADLKHELEDLFGRGGAEVGHIAELFASLLESLAKRESGYKESVDGIQKALARVRGIIEAYHPQLAIVETIEALRAQSAEREAATALLRNTVDSVKTRIREQADSLLALETTTKS